MNRLGQIRERLSKLSREPWVLYRGTESSPSVVVEGPEGNGDSGSHIASFARVEDAEFFVAAADDLRGLLGLVGEGVDVPVDRSRFGPSPGEP